MNRRHQTEHRRGFTMIEIVLVLVIISSALALAAPSLRGWGQSAKLRDVSEQFVAACRWARAEAAATASTHRIDLDSAASTYSVKRQSGAEFVPVAGELGRATALPQGFTLALASGGADGRAIQFYPNGRATPAVVRFTSTAGETAEVASAFPADLFKVTPVGGAR